MTISETSTTGRGAGDRAVQLDELFGILGESLSMPGDTAVMVLKINDFRAINISYGYEFGVNLLETAMGRIQQILPGRDPVFRLGRSELGIIFSRVIAPEILLHVAAKIKASLSRPFAAGQVSLQVRFTYGMSRALGRQVSAREMLREADQALLAAVTRQVDGIILDREVVDEATNEIEVQTQLETALARDEFSLVYQPKVDFRSRSVIGCEVLMRWNSPVLGHVSPDRFIVAAEKTGWIRDMTYWAINSSIKECLRWGKESMPIAVNLSAVTLGDPHLLELVERALNIWGFPAELLTLEVTETALMARPEHCLTMLHALRERGIRISIDDFGTGYSSLAYLKKLPVDELKIDKSFVQSILNDSGDQKIVSTVVNLGRSFGMKVVAEGIEDEATFQFLRKVGCNIAQGYFVSRPMPGDEIPTWRKLWREKMRVAIGQNFQG